MDLMIWIVIIFAALVVLWWISPAFRKKVDGFKTLLWTLFGVVGTSLEMFDVASLVPEGWDPSWFVLGGILGFGLLRIEHARRTKKPIGEQ